MKKILVLLLPVLFLVTSCYKKYNLDFSRFYEGDDDDPEIEIPDGLMIMSSNMRYYQGTVKGQDKGDRAWEKRRNGYYAMVNKLQPIVLGVQEAEMNQVADVLANCSGYASIGVGRDDGAQKGESTSIFYKKDLVTIEDWGTLWMSDTPEVPGSKYVGDDNPRTLTWALIRLKELDMTYLHLNTHTSLSAEYQKKEIDLILKTVDNLAPGDTPVIMTGDWNMEENNPILAPIFLTFQSARQIAKLTDNQYTFSAWSSTDKQHLDHIFVRNVAKIPQFTRVPAVWATYSISDHYPVYAIAEFPTAPIVVDPPVAEFSFPETIKMDEPVTFMDESVCPVEIESWSWTIGGKKSTEQNPTVTFRSFGDEINVSLTVQDVFGRFATVAKNIKVEKSEGHELTKVWSTQYDDKGFVYWTNPSMNTAEDRIYVTSTGLHLVCLDLSGNIINSFDVGMYHPYMTDDLQRQMPTPSVDKDGNVYLPVQYGYSASGNGGLFCLNEDCSEMKWYLPTGKYSQYNFTIVPVFGDYIALPLTNVDETLCDGQLRNFNVFKRTTGEFVQGLDCDKGSYGGVAVTRSGKIVYGAARGSDSDDGAGYKVAVPDGAMGKWKTSPNTSAGRKTNLLGGRDASGVGYQTKGCQPCISNDGYAYVCLTSSGNSMVVAKYRIEDYVSGQALKPVWENEVSCTVARNGHGIALDSEGNAYVQSGTHVFRLNADDGELAWIHETNSGNCGMPAVDNLGYVYVCDFHGHELLKLSPDDGSVISSIPISAPRSCPLIAKDGSIYINAAGPTIHKISCSRTSSYGDNWSQLGCNPQKTCTPKGFTY